MALVVNDRVKETSTTTGTGTFTLDGAVTGFETFSSAIGNSNTTYYAIEIPNSTEFEVGLGTVSAGQLARTTVISSSNSDALVNFSAGTKNVFCTLPASKAVIEDASNNVTLPADLTVDTDTLYVDSSNNRVGIGTTSPDDELHITSGDGNNPPVLRMQAGGGQLFRITCMGNGTDTILKSEYGLNLKSQLDDIHLSTGNTERVTIKTSTGNVGIGTSSPTSTVDIRDANAGIQSRGLLYLSNNDTYGIDKGSQISFGGTYDISSNNSFFAAVAGRKENSTSGNFEGYLQFSTRETSGNFERMRITSAGNVGIGTTSPSATLDVDGSAIFNESGAAVDFRVEGDTNANLFFVDGSTDRVGIGGIPTERLTVIGPNNLSAATLKVKDTDGRGILISSPYSGSGVGHIGTDGTSSALGFKVNGTEYARFSTNGYFGIGTTNPSSLLHLSSSDPQITITDTDGTGSQVIKAVGDDLEFDVVGKTVIDSDSGGTLQLLDGGTSYLKFFEFGNYAALESMISDNDFKIRGNDGGAFFDALTLDMSEAGDAIFNSNIFLGDNKKANFGADSDLQIYHDGSQSIIEDVGTGQLKILAENTLYFGSATGTEKYIRALKNGIVELSYDNSAKLTTSSTGIDVTGTAVTDGLTVAGNVSVDGGTIKLDGNYPTGTNNVAMGDTAFDSVTTGADNTVIGSGAGTAVTTGQQNTVVGSTALNTGNATGNTAIGFRALRAITGANNVGIGRSAGHDASGGQNTFVGGSAGYYINGTNNVAVGYQAGNGFGTTGSSNIFMGYRAGDNITNGSNNIIIGTSADASSATASNEITLGDANITSLRIPGLQSGASSGDVLTYDGTDITLSAPTGVSAGFAVAMAIAL